MVVQHLYNDMQFDSPFLIVYIGTSLFSLFLPIRLSYERFGSQCRCCDHEIVVIPWKNNDDDVPIISSSAELIATPTRSRGSLEDHDSSDSQISSVKMTEGDYSYDNDTGECNTNHRYEPTAPHSYNNSGSATAIGKGNTQQQQHYLLSHQDHISMATKVAPLWFFSNYFYAMSLEWTSIASSTVLASMGGIFAFGFATCSRFGDERVTKGKLLGVLLCFMGGVATTWTDVGSNGREDDSSNGYDYDILDPNNNDWDDDIDDPRDGMRYNMRRYLRHPASLVPHLFDLSKDSPVRTLLGDLCGFFSAVGYGAYTVLLRHLCPKDEDRMSMQLLFGYIGVLNMTLLLPFALWVILSPPMDDDDGNQEIHSQSTNDDEWDTPNDEDGTEHHATTTLTWSIFLFLVLKGLLDNVLSDYLWARAVMLTSATVASVGVGLTIPMAFAADEIMGNATGLQAGEVWGAVFVLLGFVFVNANVFGEKGDREEDDEAEEVTFEDEDGRLDAHSAHDDVDTAILT